MGLILTITGLLLEQEMQYKRRRRFYRESGITQNFMSDLYLRTFTRYFNRPYLYQKRNYKFKANLVSYSF